MYPVEAPIKPDQTVFTLIVPPFSNSILGYLLNPRAVSRVDAFNPVPVTGLNFRWVQTQNREDLVGPEHGVRLHIPVPSAHSACFQRQPQSRLTSAQDLLRILTFSDVDSRAEQPNRPSVFISDGLTQN